MRTGEMALHLAHDAASGTKARRAAIASASSRSPLTVTAPCLRAFGRLAPLANGQTSCFGETALAPDGSQCWIGPSQNVSRPVGAAGGYTRRLLQDRNLRLKKIGEEAAEFITACTDGDAGRRWLPSPPISIYHALVAMHAAGTGWPAVVRALAERQRHSTPSPSLNERPSHEMGAGVRQPSVGAGHDRPYQGRITARGRANARVRVDRRGLRLFRTPDSLAGTTICHCIRGPCRVLQPR